MRTRSRRIGAQIIAECIRSEDRRARKPRLQILAAKFYIAAGWTKNDIDWVRREHGGWWQPWCIRASSGRFARPAKLGNILFPNMSDRLGGAFHVTKPSALEGIILRGIVPGGNDSARRLVGHFGVFAPWDSENISTRLQRTMSKREMTSPPSTCQQGNGPRTSQESHGIKRSSPLRPFPSKRSGQSGHPSP